MRVKLVLTLLTAIVPACPAQLMNVTSDYVRSRPMAFEGSQAASPRAFALPYRLSNDPARGFALEQESQRKAVPPFRMRLLPPRRSYPISAGEPTCYFIRSYYARRDAPESDATRIVGQSVCTMSSRFWQKQAIQPAPKSPAVLPAVW